MARIYKDLQKCALPPRVPQEARLQGEYLEPGERPDGKGPGLAIGLLYTKPEDRPLRGPYEFGCRHEDALCYDVPLARFRAQQVVSAFLEREYVQPVTLRQLAAGWHNGYALLTDGTVLHAGWGAKGEADCTQWQDVAQITATEQCVLGLSPSGVLFAGDWNNGAPDPNLGAWSDVVSIHACSGQLIGVTASGSVRYYFGASEHSDYWGIKPVVAGWSNVVKAVAGTSHVLGLQADGTVLAAGDDSSGKVSDAAQWTGCVDIAATQYASHALKAEGTVLCCGNDLYGLVSSPGGWSGVASLAGESGHLLGCKNDGSVVYAGSSPGCSDPLPFADWSDVQACAVGRNLLLGRTVCKALACGSDDYGAASGAEALFDYCL